MKEAINYILVFLFFGLICYYLFFRSSKIEPTYIQGKPDTVTVYGKPDTVTVTKRVYIEKKFSPNPKSGDITPGVAALTPLVDTLITRDESFIHLKISSTPVPDSLLYSINWVEKERTIRQIDTLLVTQVDTIKIADKTEFWKGVVYGAAGVVTTGVLAWRLLK